jgi:rSAM/selenodomain-associated transferase 2
VTLTIIIPTLNAGADLERCLTALDRNDLILIADGNSTDATREIADRFGATIVTTPRGRGTQLRAGAAAARSDWLLFVHADTQLEAGWRDTVMTHLQRADAHTIAAVFQFALDDTSAAARRLERMVAWRGRILGLPYGDQGLLIHRTLYDAIGGYPDIPLMEDVAIIRAIGRHRLAHLNACAITSATRWQRHGWLRRSARNLTCLSLYFAGVPPTHIAKVYGK